ncbi:MAG: isoprenylcysteine carboxylmethyltransferase family protein [Deltaproteobacteria bacterium]|jgi:protein-S-isoprenylcysteine O-methyltransferase Ste14|nr:isoprenylcysteine carboxylmethyltransferase family protein [Deltaproteobacteria bacterium]MDX9761565.1 isoprenylcysteine carboxylmethyltransferase family protein [Desulfomonilia bacterium]HPW68500.1 isoprenylcysteine carboxylmethyltransferase family protein [Deltaproteobacteria bacterium]
MASIIQFTQEYRIAISRVCGALIILLILFSGPSSPKSGPSYLDLAVDFFAFILVIASAFGRLWALAYISGHKTKDLITDGPYSMVRNPLYFFSLIGAVGIGIMTNNVLIFGLIVILFGLYYPFVIRAEENRLREVHGDAFDKYREKTPMFVPRPSLFREPPHYTIDTRLFRRAFLSVMWFPLMFMVLIVIERLHHTGILPVFFTLP